MEGNCRLNHFGTAFSRAQAQAAQTPRGEGLFAETSELERSAIAPGGQSRRCCSRMKPCKAPCRVSISLCHQKPKTACWVLCGVCPTDGPVNPPPRAPPEETQVLAAELCWQGGQPGCSLGQKGTPDQQEGAAPCSLYQTPALELQLLQAPAEQLAHIIHLVTGASGYPAEQERPAKNTRCTSPPASAPFLASSCPGGEQP